MTKIKLCSLRRQEDIEMANQLKPDYVGFIFVPERKRYISPENAKKLKAMLDPQIKAVGVFINADIQSVYRLLKDGVIDIAQLHGQEDEAYIAQLRELIDRPVWKAFKITSNRDLMKAMESTADLILLDAGGGGTGQSFDWSLLYDVTRPYLLAGGLDHENVADAVNMVHPFGVDVSSGTETDGVKDPYKMSAFVKAVRAS